MVKDDLKVSDEVLAKWPGSRNQFAPAIIVKKNANDYVVKFVQDGSTASVGYENLQIPEANLSEKKIKDDKSSSKPKATSPTRPKSPGRPKSPATPRSPGRPKSPGRSKSPATPKSPGRPRSPSKSKSPTKQKGKSPVRQKSPAKAKSLAETKTKSPVKLKLKSPVRSQSGGRKRDRSQSRSPARSKGVSNENARSRSPTKKKEKSQSPSRSKTVVDGKPKATPKTQAPEIKRRRPFGKSPVSLIQTSPDTSPEASPKFLKKRGRPTLKDKILDHGKSTLELIPLLKKIESKNKVQAIEEEEVEVRKIYSTRSQDTKKVEQLDHKLPFAERKELTKLKAGIAGIVFSTLAILMSPVFTIFLTLTCVRKRVSLFSIPQVPKNYSAYFSYEGAGVYLGFILFQALLSTLPIGQIVKGFQVKKGNAILRYRLNGIHALLANSLILAVAIYFKQPIFFVHDNFFKLSCIATAFSFLLSTALYIRALYRPSSKICQLGNSGCLPYDFHHGHETNPRFGMLFDLKLLVLRIGLIGWFAVGICLVYKAYLLNGSVSYELALVASTQGLYILDLLYREDVLLATATMMHEGLGFGMILAACATAPFTFTIPIYYLIHFKPSIPLYCLGGMLILYGLGLRMNRKSLSDKLKVKRNPEDLSLAGESIIRTKDNKPLLTSGWWGFVRHPNYTSELLMFLSWTLPCGFQNGVPYMPVLLVFLSLVRRCFQVDTIMAQHYNDAFNQYKHRVPSRMCPKIF